jgi:cysteine desulfurase / selenocysteine lyase
METNLFDENAINFLVDTKAKTRYVNLDNAATTMPFNEVKMAADNFLLSYGSIHRGAGQKSKISTDAFEKARETIRNFVNASTDNYVIFTKNTTEAINQAAALWSNIPGKVLVSDIEHSSNLLPWLKTQQIIQYKTNDDATIDLNEITKMFELHQVKLIAITGSSNVTGYKPPVHKIAEIAHSHGAKILVDACQLVQHEKLNMLSNDHKEHLDFICFSGHKMYAPYGSGVLIGPKDFFDEAMPYQIGGGNLPYITHDLEIKRFKTVRAHDPGTANAIGAITIAKAIEVLESIGSDKIEIYELSLVKYAYENLLKIPKVKIYLNPNYLGSTIPFDIEGFDSKLVAEILSQEYGIGVRAGSFCTYELMRKLKKINPEMDKKISEEVDQGITKNIPGLVRASFALSNTLEDAKRLVEAVKEISSRNTESYKKHYEQDDKTGGWKLK